MKFYEVGGCVRDQLMGLTSKDVDFAVEAPSFEVMEANLKKDGFKVFLSKPEFLTVRAQVPTSRPELLARTKVADFVLCRSDSPGSDGRRPGYVKPGTILEDLARRDFTMNAIAKDVQTGELLDPHNGARDIKNQWLRFVGDPYTRIKEDGLRVLRGLRFVITKKLDVELETQDALLSMEAGTALRKVSPDRIREELEKMFAHDTIRTLQVLSEYQHLYGYIFREGLRLTATQREA